MKNIIEKYIEIKMRDKKTIGGIFSSFENKKIIIFIHGFTGNSHEAQFYESKKYFIKKGYDVFIADLYSFKKTEERFMWNTSIKQHTEDLEDVIKSFSKQYKDIFLVGHSIGCPIIYLSKYINKNKKIKAVCFWEPTINPNGVENDFVYDKRLKKYFSFGYFVSKTFVEELKKLRSEKISNFKKPFKIIFDKDGVLVNNWKDAFSFIKSKYEIFEISNSNHDFTNNNSMGILLRETKKYFDKF